jgi:two-component system, sensor histidine kinase
MLNAALEKRIAGEQIAALFAAVNVSVSGGFAAACVLTGALYHLGAADLLTSLTWTSYIAACAASHMLLCWAYRRSQTAGDRWQAWGHWFTGISLAEGLGWGWASICLTSPGHSDVKHLVFLMVGGLCAATIPGFSPYLPAFFAIFVPAASGALAGSIMSSDPVQQAAFLLMVVFVCAMGPLGIRANQSFKQLVGLRIKTEYLAEDLREQKEIAERANLAKSTFLAAASHDLRQPVHALTLFVGALRDVPMPPEGQHLLEQIETSTNAMDGLFAALLDISRLDAGIVEVHRCAFAIEPLLERICRDHAAEANEKGLSLVRQSSRAIVDSDPVLVERILRNLVSNAVRYTNKGRILIGCRPKGAFLSVQVWDTGVGIPPDQLDRIFQEYYQVGNVERDRTKGLGLGLAIVRRLTDLLDCQLTLRSQLGRGSCFAVALPVARVAPEANTIELDRTSGAFAHGFIVVIDDELAIREAMSSLLGRWGHDVVVAASGDEATRRLSARPARPDLIICDYRLRGGENGIAVIERLRADYNERIPAMLITGDTAPDRLAEAKASGLLLLHKPVSNTKLRAAIIHLIADPDIDSVADA